MDKDTFDTNKIWDHCLTTDTHPDTEEKGEQTDTVRWMLTVLWHSNPERVGETSLLPAFPPGKELAISRLTPLFTSGNDDTPKPLADPRLSRRGVLLRSRDDGVEIDATATTMQVWLDGNVETGRCHITDQRIRDGVIVLLARRVALLLQNAPDISPQTEMPDIIGDSAAIRTLKRNITGFAETDDTVLIVGESGTGKELVAAELRKQSPRRNKPFIKLNMGALPASLCASELFGTAKGAFSGAAQQRQGFFQQADRGTLFLDEIGETPSEVQATLLRALESGEIQPLGAQKPFTVNVRVIAATDARLSEAIASGSFKLPLYYRLSSFTIKVPPLRERKSDIGRLLRHFINRTRCECGEPPLMDLGPRCRPWLRAETVAGLAMYDWPGNVRQLANIAKQLVVNSRGFPEAFIDVEIRALTAVAPRPPRPPRQTHRKQRDEPYKDPLEVDESLLKETLRHHDWNLKSTAADLGLSRASLYNLIDRYPSIRKAGDLSKEEILSSRQRCRGKLTAMVADLEVSLNGLKRRMKQLGLLPPR